MSKSDLTTPSIRESDQLMNDRNRNAIDNISIGFTKAIEVASRFVLGPIIMLMEVAVSGIFYYSIVSPERRADLKPWVMVACIVLAVIASAVKTGIWNAGFSKDKSNLPGLIVSWIVILIHASTIVGGSSIIAGADNGQLFPTDPTIGQVIVIGLISVLCIGNKLIVDVLFGRKPNNLRPIRPSFYDQDEDVS